MVKTKIATVAILVVTFSALFVLLVTIQKKPRVPTFSDLPEGVVYVSHPHEEREALAREKIPMTHYATPEAIAAGGPIFGTVGYRIVAVEYEIPSSNILERSVGTSFSGYLLNQPSLKGFPIDHMHISEKENVKKSYDIHFMLISHEEEERNGIYCE